jgi:hypothetical protein
MKNYEGNRVCKRDRSKHQCNDHKGCCLNEYGKTHDCCFLFLREENRGGKRGEVLGDKAKIQRSTTYK